ncbi:hypothetical protein F383_21722 [Gossypium arboreum]|uniref:Uncharacterized protein n=1 Tax=Gossypium arboreum TaxID=29729 RepID=A0A0B0NUF2_GOSAR|nr:hypothetical protein F383_21722 [Gossypium arboreum]
MSHWLNQIVN